MCLSCMSYTWVGLLMFLVPKLFNLMGFFKHIITGGYIDIQLTMNSSMYRKDANANLKKLYTISYINASFMVEVTYRYNILY